MQCPNCRQGSLIPTEIEIGLVGAGCQTCEGIMLPLLNYRYWIQHQGTAMVNDNVDQRIEADDSKHAKLCPKCSKMMTKYRIGLQKENRIELCGNCDEVWLDFGEWQLIKSLELHIRLPDIMTEAWQRKLRKEREQENWQNHYESQLGEAVFAKVKDFKTWLDQQPHKGDIQHYLNTRFD